tara:strand:+ start:499 stop:987 length:489 start_codon:yes stop_codon:yes gene_type:complete
MRPLTSIIALIVIASTACGAVSPNRICLDVRKYSKDAEISIYDTEYNSIDVKTLKEVRASHREMRRKYAPSFFKGRKFDCDDHAFTFKAMVSYHSLMQGKNFQCGVIMVKQVRAFGDVTAGGRHALNIILVDGELKVLEPQTYKITPLSKYPNRSNITRLIL